MDFLILLGVFVIIFVCWLFARASNSPASNTNNNVQDMTRNIQSSNQQLTDPSVKVNWDSNKATYNTNTSNKQPTILFKKEFSQLENLLKEHKWREADQETDNQIERIVGKDLSRDLVDPEDIRRFPSDDLKIIDTLWVKYSNGHFGFSVQKRIWLECGGNPAFPNHTNAWQAFAQRTGFSNNPSYTLDAPPGNLPDCVRTLSFSRLELLARPDLPSHGSNPSPKEINRLAYLDGNEFRVYYFCGYGDSQRVTYLGKQKEGQVGYMFKFRSENTGNYFELSEADMNSIDLTPA